MIEIFRLHLVSFIAQHGRREAAARLGVSPRALASLRAGTLRPTAGVLAVLGLAEVTRPKTAPQAEQAGNSGHGGAVPSGPFRGRDRVAGEPPPVGVLGASIGAMMSGWDLARQFDLRMPVTRVMLDIDAADQRAARRRAERIARTEVTRAAGCEPPMSVDEARRRMDSIEIRPEDVELMGRITEVNRRYLHQEDL